jgi:hypothetical protein
MPNKTIITTSFSYNTERNTYSISENGQAATKETSDPMEAWQQYISLLDSTVTERIRDMWEKKGLNRYTGK